MAGVFISYRRIDAGRGWAGRLFDHLGERFGRSQVFMDIEGGIPRGADFAARLAEALNGCDALLALVGPEWVGCTRSDGRRRLDIPDDWVRREIATALERGIVVVPVLLGGAPLPDEAQIPEELRPMRGKQAAVLREESWEADVAKLAADLATQTSLAAASGGLRLLRDLMVRFPAVAEAVARSAEVLEGTSRQLHRLAAHKEVHDQLHLVEFECYRPMREPGAPGRLRRFRLAFAGARGRIEKAAAGGDLSPRLRGDIGDLLQAAAQSLQAAADSGGEVAQEAALADLERVLTRLPPDVDAGLTDTARLLEIDRLVELLAAVRSRLPGTGPEIEPLLRAVDALGRLRDELRFRVEEHGQLQALDSRLRTALSGAVRPEALPAEWKGCRRLRSILSSPARTPELAAAAAVASPASAEAEVDGALARGDLAGALELVREYHYLVSSAFRDADAGLREFCMRLGEVSAPVRLVLEMSRAGSAG